MGLDSISWEGGLRPPLAFEPGELDLFMGPMSAYPELKFSMKAVRRAGERLASDIVMHDEMPPDERAAILETFAIANSWRDSHVFPMRSMRFSVNQRMRKLGIQGITAARPKRMSSIRKKLKRIGVKLEQINDIAGCRAILDNIDGVRALIAECETNLPHELRQPYPYIWEPKSDGYRSHHMVFKFCGSGEKTPFDGRRVELQIRTRLQHSWATAVEAVGLYRGEDMKAGLGSDTWLRLFSLMSAEFAEAEKCPVHDQMPSRSNRIREIRDLNKEINAAGVLEDIKAATHYSQTYYFPEKPRYYLIQ